MGQIVTLQTRPDRLRRDHEEAARQALLPLEGVIPGDLMRDIVGLLDRRSASRNKWTFVMLSPAQNGLVVRYLADHSERPVLALKAWALCFEHLRNDTGEVLLTREQFADNLGVALQHVSNVMSELVEFGAIIRRRERVGGMRGPGLVRYFMNPRVATHLAGVERDKAQDDAPQLRLV